MPATPQPNQRRNIPARSPALRCRGPTGPVRIGFVLRSFTYGGAEHDIIQLMTAADPEMISVVGMAIQIPYPICPDLNLDDPRVCPLYQPGAITRHAKVIRTSTFAEAVRRVASESDILVAWGVPDLSDEMPPDFRGHLVVTSKASGAYQESFLHENALLTTHYVANSRKSVEAFPAAVQHRVQVIYPGVDARRLASERTRDEQRALWQMYPADRVVGYLGRIAPDKGVEQIVEAARGMGPEWSAVFVGRNANFPDYERSFARLCRRKLPGRHRIIDWTTDVAPVLQAFDVLAYPTQDEGFSNTLAEAWLLGVPTVATAGVGALIEKPWSRCCITVSGGYSAPQLQHALLRAYGHRRLVAHARCQAQRLTVRATLDAWQTYFTGIMSAPRRTRVMVLLPNALIGGMTSWLITLMRHTPLIDWCCLCVMSETDDYAGDVEVLEPIVAGGCPVLGVPPLSDEDTQQRLLRALRQSRPDVVLQCGVKRLDERYPRTEVPLVSVSHAPASCGWARDVLRHSSRVATELMAVSASARDSFPARVRSRVRIISNGVDVPPVRQLNGVSRRAARERLQLDENVIAVGFVGRLSAEKNPLIVARAMRYLPESHRAVFVGPDCGGFVDAIRKMTRRFVHMGGVSGANVAQLMPGLDVLVCPSDYESFGLVIAEAWAARVPVVSTPVGIVTELAPETDVAVVVPVSPGPKVLASAIQRAINERDKRVPLCRELVSKHYSARTMGQRWQQALRQLAGHSLQSRETGLLVPVHPVTHGEVAPAVARKRPRRSNRSR